MNRRPHPTAILLLVGAAAGLLFAAISTYDFVQHLDRQVHDIHCSFVPGVEGSSSSSGCKQAMLSPYSSVFRSDLWGGIPISLPAMAVFAFLAFLGAEVVLGGRQSCRRSTGLLLLASLIPAGASVVMGVISATELGTACKLCVGIYIASALCLAGAAGMFARARKAQREGAPSPMPQPPQKKEPLPSNEPAWVSARPAPEDEAPERPEMARTLRPDEVPPMSSGEAQRDPREEAQRDPREEQPRRGEGRSPEAPAGQLVFAVVLGVVFVAAPMAAYAALAPDHEPYVGACGELEVAEDTYGVSVPLDSGGDVPAIELLDPLCPACRAFEERLALVESASALDRRAVLFPLDSTCNWMVDEAVHPGACGVSEAVLCAGDAANEVVTWAFDNQEAIIEKSKADPKASRQMAGKAFPELADCIGSPKIQSKLNQSLRWIVKNHLPVLTPQLFINGTKLCDEDVDLGLEFALERMINARKGGAK